MEANLQLKLEYNMNIYIYIYLVYTNAAFNTDKVIDLYSLHSSM